MWIERTSAKENRRLDYSLGTLLFHSFRFFRFFAFQPVQKHLSLIFSHFHLVLLVMTTHSFIQFLPQIWNRLWTWLDLCKPNELRCDVFTMRSEMSYNNNTNYKKFKWPAFDMRRWLSTFRRNCDCKLFSPLVTRSAQYTSSYRISNEYLTKWNEATTRCVCVCVCVVGASIFKRLHKLYPESIRPHSVYWKLLTAYGQSPETETLMLPIFMRWLKSKIFNDLQV